MARTSDIHGKRVIQWYRGTPTSETVIAGDPLDRAELPSLSRLFHWPEDVMSGTGLTFRPRNTHPDGEASAGLSA